MTIHIINVTQTTSGLFWGCPVNTTNNLNRVICKNTLQGDHVRKRITKLLERVNRSRRCVFVVHSWGRPMKTYRRSLLEPATRSDCVGSAPSNDLINRFAVKILNWSVRSAIFQKLPSFYLCVYSGSFLTRLVYSCETNVPFAPLPPPVIVSEVVNLQVLPLLVIPVTFTVL